MDQLSGCHVGKKKDKEMPNNEEDSSFVVYNGQKVVCWLMHISFLVFTVWELLWCFAQKDLECLSKMCEETASRKFWEFTPREIKLTTVKSFFWHRRNCFYHNCWTAHYRIFFLFFRRSENRCDFLTLTRNYSGKNAGLI